jgi:mono/diheme cytochrome c family protein
MRRALTFLAVLVAGTAAAGMLATRPDMLPDTAFATLDPGDAARGAAIFAAAGCASCHAAPGATGDVRRVLSGGQAFDSDFGTFHAPNISSDVTHGIGGWSLPEFANAVMRGVAPDGRHYYPAFPYTAYARMDLQDVADLHAHMVTLPPSEAANLPHDLAFPFGIRRGIGLWKARYAGQDWVLPDPLSPDLARGRYLVEALAHCAECHTPRDTFGGLDRTQWLAGAPNPSGDGRIPGITPAQLGWTAEDIATYLETGFTPAFDVVGGSMSKVVDAMAMLPESDRMAIARYLLAVPDAPR